MTTCVFDQIPHIGALARYRLLDLRNWYGAYAAHRALNLPQQKVGTVVQEDESAYSELCKMCP